LRVAAGLALGVLLAGPGLLPVQAQVDDVTSPAVWFDWVDIYVDSGDVPLGAYQFELSAAVGEVKIVGVEGGEHPAFAEPPYYDPAALQEDRIIIAAYSLADELPTHRTRVARVHVQVTGDKPAYAVELTVAADAEGNPLDAAIAEGDAE
jgi:hypothetical protein